MIERFKRYLPFIRKYGTYLWLGAILILAVYVGLNQRDDLRKTWDLIVGADPRWIVSILILEAVSFVLIAAVYGLVLHQLGYRLSLALMISLHLQRAVINGLTPLGGPSSVVVFVTRLRHKGVPPADSLLAAFIKSVSGHVAFLLILLPALFIGDPTFLMFASTGCLVVLVAAMLTFLSLIMRRRRLPGFLIARIPRRGLRMLVQLRRHRIEPQTLAWPMV
ncbi:MAG TPA: lysylphosphatidylglycerol synthase domain-containing protein, partial [Thermomicrobiales bacterium]|nr:lysylphosphatidylglycerol synthase domain-containing protein [Thermomicrobiales bacterium]